MNYIVLLLLAIIISDLFYSFKNINFQITGSCYFKYKNKYYEHFFVFTKGIQDILFIIQKIIKEKY